MFLGAPRLWMIAAGALFVGGLALVATEIGGALGNVAGVLLVAAGIVSFAAAPMRSGRTRPQSAEERTAPDIAAAPAEPRRPRPIIEAGDASEV